MARSMSAALRALIFVVALGTVCLFVGCSKHSETEPDVPGGPAAEAVHQGGKDITQSIEKGNATECKSNIDQVRMAIQMYKDANDHFPPSLADLDRSVKDVETCPDSHQPYQYDPATGTVKCLTPGHGKF